VDIHPGQIPFIIDYDGAGDWDIYGKVRDVRNYIFNVRDNTKILTS
jgi:hypothetical protein